MRFCFLILAAALAACSASEERTPVPPPQAITPQAVGHYCTMSLFGHNGPKAQVFINGKHEQPLWFSTVKQMFGYTKLPEDKAGIRVMYVTDMGQVADWNAPNADGAWVDARQAYYVIESGFVGGMGAEDALPFAERGAAEQFAAERGGRVVAFHEMPDAYIFR